MVYELYDVSPDTVNTSTLILNKEFGYIPGLSTNKLYIGEEKK